MDSEATRAVSYDELASLRTISLAAAKNLVRRKRWPRMRANDGLVRVQVPVSELRESGPQESPREDPQGSPHEGHPGTLARLVELERHNARLEAINEALTRDLNAALTKIDAADRKALMEAATMAAIEATLNAIRDERDRLQAERTQRASVPSIPPKQTSTLVKAAEWIARQFGT